MKTVRISINISLQFVPKGLINNILALVQIMAWHRPSDKPLSEPKMVNLLTHECIIRPQWVKLYYYKVLYNTHTVWIQQQKYNINPALQIYELLFDSMTLKYNT